MGSLSTSIDEAIRSDESSGGFSTTEKDRTTSTAAPALSSSFPRHAAMRHYTPYCNVKAAES